MSKIPEHVLLPDFWDKHDPKTFKGMQCPKDGCQTFSSITPEKF